VRTHSLAPIALCLVAVLPLAAQATHPAAPTQVKMLDCAGLPCVDVQIGSSAPIRLMIDTGNGHSVLDLAQAKSLGLALEPYVSRSGKTIPGVYFATAPTVQLGALTLGPVKFIAADLTDAVKQGQFPQSAGTLDYVDFRDRVLTLDYPKHTIEIADASSAAPAGAGTLTYPTFGQQGPPIVATTGFAVNGQPITVQVDILYTGTLLIYPTSVSRLGLDAAAAATQTRDFPFTDGGVPMIESKAAHESFGGSDLMAGAPLYFATPKVHTPDGLFDGTVGNALLTGHRVTFDFKSNRFWLD
jgi:hypothetical protein